MIHCSRPQQRVQDYELSIVFSPGKPLMPVVLRPVYDVLFPDTVAVHDLPLRRLEALVAAAGA